MTQEYRICDKFKEKLSLFDQLFFLSSSTFQGFDTRDSQKCVGGNVVSFEWTGRFETPLHVAIEVMTV